MARRRSNRSFSGGFEPSTYRLPQLNAIDQLRALVKTIEDRRRFHPLGVLRPPGALRRTSRRVVVSKPRSAGFFPEPGLSFSVGRDIALCARRKERREIIFAKRKQGKGSRSFKRKRNYWSQVRC